MSITNKVNTSSYGYFVCIVGACIGLLFGLDIGVIAGALPHITKEFMLSPEQQGFIVSIILIGAVVGVFVCKPLSIKYGRRKTLLIAVILYTVGAILSGFAPSYDALIMARFLLGIALGMASLIAPLYLGEIAPKRLRGAVISVYQVMINTGIVLAYLDDAILTTGGHWRWMLSLIAIPSTIAGIFFIFLPRSPRWLVLKNKLKEAKNVLFHITPVTDVVEKDLKEIKQAAKKNVSGGLSELKDKRMRKVLILGVFLMMLQQYTGINIIVYYAPEVYKAAGFASIQAQMWCTLAAGVVNMIIPLIAAMFVDNWGRKPILYTGLSIVAFGLLLAAAVQYAPKTHFFAMISLISTFIFIGGFAFSLGPIIWVICAELFPLKARELGLMFVTASNWFFTAVLGQVFPPIVSAFGLGPILICFSFIAIAGFFMVGFFVPETKGVTLEYIERNLMAGKKLRHLGKTKRL